MYICCFWLYLQNWRIWQCLVTGKHHRLRLVHTIAIMDSGEEVQVLRVAAYGEQWTGPCNMNAIR